MSRTRRASLLLAVLVALGATATGAETLRTDLTKAFNDTVGGKPVVATYCPLCNSGLVFERSVDGALLGRAVRGPLAGQRLSPVAHVDAFCFAWAAFHPSTTVHDDR